MDVIGETRRVMNPSARLGNAADGAGSGSADRSSGEGLGEGPRSPLGAPVADLLGAAQSDVLALLERLGDPEWPPEAEDLRLPALLQEVERLARTVAAVQTSLAGHLAQVYGHEADRHELLGIPPGKSPHRDEADCLRSLLHIDRRDAQRRLRRAEATRPQRAFATAPVAEPQLPAIARVVAAGAAEPGACDVVIETLTRARTDALIAGVPRDEVEDLVDAGEAILADQLQRIEPDGIRRLCARWRQNLDALVMPDTAAPTEAELNAAQGLFHRGHRRGLHRWDLHLTDAQHEVLQTVASAATNPRAVAGVQDAGSAPDPRTRGQRQADTLVSALQAALAHAGAEALPSTGGNRPQVLVTIDHRTLLGELRAAADGRMGSAVSTADLTGPIDPREIRRIACDADIIPAVLGGEGEILDLGRARRLFTRAQRRAVTARDGGCAAPGCALPASWCEVHHIGHWEHGGPTDVANGVLLCSHHHQAVHAGWWEVSVIEGVPWFVPARHLDPDRTPRRNQHHRTRPGPPGAAPAPARREPLPPPERPALPEPWTRLQPPLRIGRAQRSPGGWEESAASARVGALLRRRRPVPARP